MASVSRRLQTKPRLNFIAIFDFFPQYFNKEQKDYNGGRLKDDFINFMKDPANPLSGQELPKPTPESG